MNVFLDLEGTVITSWGEGLLTNITKVRDALQARDTKNVRLFSFAVQNPVDQSKFRTHFKPLLEKALDVVFLDSPSVVDFQQADSAVGGFHWDSQWEFIRVRGKADAFRSWCKVNFPGQHNILIDDAVPNATWRDADSGLVLDYVNVDSLTEPKPPTEKKEGGILGPLDSMGRYAWQWD